MGVTLSLLRYFLSCTSVQIVPDFFLPSAILSVNFKIHHFSLIYKIILIKFNMFNWMLSNVYISLLTNFKAFKYFNFSSFINYITLSVLVMACITSPQCKFVVSRANTWESNLDRIVHTNDLIFYCFVKKLRQFIGSRWTFFDASQICWSFWAVSIIPDFSYSLKFSYLRSRWLRWGAKEKRSYLENSKFNDVADNNLEKGSTL